MGQATGIRSNSGSQDTRKKIDLLSAEQQPAQWAATLCSDWMEMAPAHAGTFYIDGHVRFYHGQQTRLPRHYVARQKLCLRVTTDYWVNAMDSQPFFVVNQAIATGMIKVLEQEIVPQLKQQVPNQLSAREQQENTLLHRFVMIFDREGYSPEFMLRMKQQHIACQSHHKFPGEGWPVEEFYPQNITLVSGHVVEMKIAERGTHLLKRKWVREIRKLCDGGKQTGVLSTNYLASEAIIADAMFARWSQENFFKYMRENYNLDALASYSTDSIPDATPVSTLSIGAWMETSDKKLPS
jgi:hypothetical protein